MTTYPSQVTHEAERFCPLCSQSRCAHTVSQRMRAMNALVVIHTDVALSYDKRATKLLEQLKIHDIETYFHSLRVGEYMHALALSLRSVENLLGIDEIRRMGTFHDIGKLATCAEVLSRKGPITKEEYDSIKQHTRIGYQLLDEIDPIAACAAGKHHPTYAVEEYPTTLSRATIASIDEWVCILTCTDFFDAFTTRRDGQYMELNNGDECVIRTVMRKQFTDYGQHIELLLNERRKRYI